MNDLSKLGRKINQNVGPTFATYAPLLAAREAAIHSTRHETFQYGDDPRQALDVYYPKSNSSRGPKPVLMWIYGGGFTQGDKVLPGYANGTVYGNVGHFFATTLSFTVVVPNYRLVSDGGRFPSGGEDLALAIAWVRDCLTKQDGYGSINLFLMGNSAGGVHLATYLLHRQFNSSRESITKYTQHGVKLRAVIFLSVPFHFEQAPKDRVEALEGYFGGKDLMTPSPLGLLRSNKLDNAVVESGVKFSVWTGSLDPIDEILGPTADFQREWEGPSLQSFVLNGHNHMSQQLSLGTGITQEEEWGVEVGRFCEFSCP
ncbi:COesterase domain-containing protein [Fusarium falciforme]|uniref:COesterase domain-containing protein n=1 Tax=Fusarium falciforme TaxID=195108 RepID=UPI0023017CA1|nr:COesterase domain-containing protein [Fusarium falciforme]WAO94466.1 COesterase domain-containing protein [Fusarium falciforme]